MSEANKYCLLGLSLYEMLEAMLDMAYAVP